MKTVKTKNQNKTPATSVDEAVKMIQTVFGDTKITTYEKKTGQYLLAFNTNTH